MASLTMDGEKNEPNSVSWWCMPLCDFQSRSGRSASNYTMSHPVFRRFAEVTYSKRSTRSKLVRMMSEDKYTLYYNCINFEQKKVVNDEDESDEVDFT